MYLYIKKARLIIGIFMAGMSINALSLNCDNVLDRMLQLTNKFQSSLGTNDYTLARKEYEEFYEDSFSPHLDKIVNDIIRNSDEKKLDKIIRIIVDAGGTVDEELAIGLGVIYQADKELFNSVVNRLPVEDEKLIRPFIEFGVAEGVEK